MSVAFFEQVAVARERYLAFYRRVMNEWGTDPNLAVEVLVQPNGRASPPPFCLMRVDALLGGSAAPRVQRIADQIVRELPATFTLTSGLEIHQVDFSWEALRLGFSAQGFRIDALKSWFHYWLDVDELREADSSGLSGVVHDLAWSHVEPNSWRLDLDFGSAPLAALEQLLELLTDAGVARVDASRHDLDEADA